MLGLWTHLARTMTMPRGILKKHRRMLAFLGFKIKTKIPYKQQQWYKDSLFFKMFMK